jgi:uncharacterized protein YabN with tetrapyrrole methylase and pyrophosphatase domain
MAESGMELTSANMPDMDAFWDEAKRAERA